jgi:AraC-like DNA-binding protein
MYKGNIVKSLKVHPVSGPVMPWSASPRQFIKEVKSQLRCDSLLIGVFDASSPRPDAVLAVDGPSVTQLAQWCEAGCKRDGLFKTARRKGSAQGKTTKSRVETPLPPGQHVAVEMLPASLDRKRFWYVAAGRKGAAIDELFQQQVAWLLRLVQVEFDHIAERGMGRILLGADHRLIHADPSTLLHIGRATKDIMEPISELLPAIIAQRWTKLTDAKLHDTMLVISGKVTWARFGSFTAVSNKLPGLYIELRPTEKGDVLPVAVVGDDRIANALGYLTDNFAQAPTLNDVADFVHISPFHFHRLFSRQVGLSPKHYVLRFRFQVAKWLLRASRMQVGAIAAATGFSSHGHFTATFHRVIGVSPTEYRSKA